MLLGISLKLDFEGRMGMVYNGDPWGCRLCCPCLIQLGKMNALRSEHECGYRPSILQLDGLLLTVPLALALVHHSGTTWLENTTTALLELVCAASQHNPAHQDLPSPVCWESVRGITSPSLASLLLLPILPNT